MTWFEPKAQIVVRALSDNRYVLYEASNSFKPVGYLVYRDDLGMWTALDVDQTHEIGERSCKRLDILVSVREHLDEQKAKA